MSLPISAANAARLAPIAQVPCGFITEIAWSPDGGTLAVAHGGGVHLWEGGFGGAPTRTLTGHGAPVKGGAFSPDSRVIATASSDATVRLWDVATGQPLDVLREQADAVNAVAFSPDGRLLTSGGADKRVRVMNREDPAEVVAYDGHTGEITSVGFAGNVLASGGWDGEVWLWGTAPDHPRAATTIPLGGWVRHIAASPDGSTIAAACKDGTLSLIDVSAGQVTHKIPAHERGVDAVAFSPDGSLLVSGGRDHVIRLWDARSPSAAPLALLTGHVKPVLTVAFHPFGSLLASGGGDNTVRLWGVAG